jgi:DtxR family transcriptional regulator, Mn-dependent transcriptional regulator
MNTKNPSGISSNLGDYLWAIDLLQNKNTVARGKDIAEMLNVTRASVTGSLKALRNEGFINYEPYSFITLTRKGEAVAKELHRRQNTIQEFFENVLCMSYEQAQANASRLKHTLDTDAEHKMELFTEFIMITYSDYKWRNAFETHCRDTSINNKRRKKS